MTLLKKISATAAVALAAGTLVATEAYATEGYFQNALGARSKGMAGAGVANSKDATAITLNPAGLVHAGRQFNGSVSIFMPFRQYESTFNGASLVAPTKYKSLRNIFAVPNMAYSHPLDEDSVLGFSLSGNGGMNTTYQDGSNSTPGCFFTPGLSGSGAFCGGKSGIDLTQVNIAAAYATKIGKHLSVGVSPIFAIQRFKAKGIEAFGGISSDPGNLSDRGYDYSFGGGVRFGVEFALDERIRVGASYQSKLLMSRFKKYSGLFAERGDFDIPANFQVGVAVDVRPDLTLMADFRHIMYSDVKSINNTGVGAADQLGLSNGAGFGWRDVSVVKFGMEYNASEDLTLRAGYSFNTQPIPDSEVSFNILAPATVQHHITGGASYKFNPNSEVEFAAMFAPSQTVHGDFIDIKMHQLEFTVGYNYHFN